MTQCSQWAFAWDWNCPLLLRVEYLLFMLNANLSSTVNWMLSIHTENTTISTLGVLSTTHIWTYIYVPVMWRTCINFLFSVKHYHLFMQNQSLTHLSWRTPNILLLQLQNLSTNFFGGFDRHDCVLVDQSVYMEHLLFLEVASLGRLPNPPRRNTATYCLMASIASSEKYFIYLMWPFCINTKLSVIIEKHKSNFKKYKHFRSLKRH